ncbi:MAG TPA: hypothetical protein VLG67_02580, partial [Candidatus Saccharimonadales bacterium]|nr:hypothetical protein [Candidatus Saccharimonadales bacterium]
DTKLENMPDQTPTDRSISPETYIGSMRMLYLSGSGKADNGKQDFTLDDHLDMNHFSLGGSWDIEDEYSIAGKNATLNYNFNASKVYLVMRPGSAKNAQVKVYLDGKLIDAKSAGPDVKNGIVNVDSDRLYNLVDFKDKTERHILKLEYVTPGVEVFAFTFG